MSDQSPRNNNGLVANSGPWKGLHPGMGLAAKGMVAAFVVFTALNVDFANDIYSAVRGWIEGRAELVLHQCRHGDAVRLFLSDVQQARAHQAR